MNEANGAVNTKLPFAGWPEKHPALVVSGIILILFVARVYIFAGSTIAAKEIVRHVATADMGVSIVLALMPLVVSFGFATSALHQSRLACYCWSVPLGLLSLLLSPIAFFVICLVIFVAVRVSKIRSRSVLPICGFLASTQVIALLFSTAAWVPVERVHMTDGTTYIAYVISNDAGGFATLIEVENNDIVKVKTDAIEARVVCRFQRHNWLRDPLLFIIKDQDPPACVDE